MTIYACGLTPQAPAHIGHMRGAVLFDVITRWFEYLGFQVDYVQNFTDIDDKIIHRSQEENLLPDQVAKKYGQMYLDDLAAIGIRPARFVYVTQNIPSIVGMIEKIIANGLAYEVDGDVYFRVQAAKEYGKLSNRDLESMQAGARIEVDDRKEHPMDFALWKSAKPGEPSWESPWGLGRPGWHIECSALSLKELGPNFDIHAGGMDLVFPHHENEIAQAEAYLGSTQFAKYWLHWGAVQLDKTKMSKSEGNVFSVREVLDSYSPGALRLFLLGTRYRSPVEYSDERMREAQQSYSRIRNTLQRVKQLSDVSKDAPPDPQVVSQFEAAMNADFNTASALAAMFVALGELHELLAAGVSEHRERISALYASVVWAAGMLGLEVEASPSEAENLDGLMQKVIEWRELLRSEKQFAMADRIRGDLQELGIRLEDSVEGTTWRAT